MLPNSRVTKSWVKQDGVIGVSGSASGIGKLS